MACGGHDLGFIIGDEEMKEMIEFLDVIHLKDPVYVVEGFGDTLKAVKRSLTGGDAPGVHHFKETGFVHTRDVVLQHKMVELILLTGKDIKELDEFYRHLATSFLVRSPSIYLTANT